MGLFGLFSGGSKSGSKNQPNSAPAKINYDKIKCPYCFKEFSHKDVHFKAMTLKAGESGENMLDDFLADEEEEAFDFFSGAQKQEESSETVDKSLEQLFTEQKDSLYQNFWNRYANKPNWKYANYPVITNKDGRMMNGGFKMDMEGFVDSVEDVFGETSRIRICPHCHNPLPVGYGKYPVHFIATVGITSSGKTVYLSQLMRNMDTIMTNVGLSTVSMTEADEKFIHDYPVKKDVPLPQGNTPGALSEPLFYVILNNGQRHTLVFYDVAGENYVVAEGMEKFGPFIKNADGIIMILDPDQFSRVREDMDDNIAKPKAVLQAMFNAFLSSQNVGGKTNIPLALALSKSDKLQGSSLVNPNSNIFRDIQYDPQNRAFDMKQYRNVMGEVKRFLRDTPEGSALMVLLENCFSRYGFFAFSALNCGTRTEEVEMNGEIVKLGIPVSHPMPLRIEEPFLWLMNQFGIVRAANNT